MKKPFRLALLTVLSLVCLLALSVGPVLADEIGTTSTDPVSTDPVLLSDSGPGAVTGSPGDPGDGTVDATPPDSLPVDVTPMEKTVDVTPGADDGLVYATDVNGTDVTPGIDETSGDPAVLDDGIRTLTGAAASSTPWPLMAGIGAAGLLVGFAVGFFVRKPKAAPKA